MDAGYRDLSRNDVELRFQEKGGSSVVSIFGEIDLFTRDIFRSGIFEHIENGNHKIVIDLDGLDFMDSNGIAVLIEIYKKIREKTGDLKIRCSRESTRKLFSITGLDKVFVICEDLEACCRQAVEMGSLAGR